MNPSVMLRMGMVGGGKDAFIGSIHRMAARLDGQIVLSAGALSSTPERALASGRALGLPDERNYPTWREMLEGERSAPPDQRIDFVSIVTPNDTHFAIAQAFVQAGFHVVCDKPLVRTSTEAQALVRAVRESGVRFAVTYNYSGYPMVRQARDMVRQGELGDLRRVMVEYHQGWLATRLEETGHKQASWRTDPDRAGAAGALGDIGSHAEQLVAFVTELEVDKLCADLTTAVEGRRLDDDASVLIRYVGGARGVLTASQVCIGCANDLRLRVWGAKGGLEWRQENPNYLRFSPLGGVARVHERSGVGLVPDAKAATRLPSGHPEGYIEAFANLYRAFAGDLRATKSRVPADRPDYPTVFDGARGVHFIERAIHSAATDAKWTDARWVPPS